MKTTPTLNFQLTAENRQLRVARFGANDLSWLADDTPSGLFAIQIDGKPYDVTTLELQNCVDEPVPGGVRSSASFQGPGFVVEQHMLAYTRTALLETWLTVHCTGPQPCRITRLDSFSFTLPYSEYELHWYKSAWGSEFEPKREKLPGRGRLAIESDAGRSSRLCHPWFALERPGGEILSGSIAWSGNWGFRFEPLGQAGLKAGGGLLDRGFEKVLQPGESMAAPQVALVFGRNLNEVSQQYAAVGRAHWYPDNQLSRQMPVEWNHWWPYEDVEINEKVFAANIDKAAEMGFEICTLDAGWFGPSDVGTHWYDYRGDWALVNTNRFPSGIRPLADRAHAKGMRFGIWCEIEALGVKAHLAEEHPEFVTLRDGRRLGYVCFGNPAVQEWAYKTLKRLITEYSADWIKLDFNLDPELGCDRADHGHGAGDGLYEHYMGYYKTLTRVRADFPEVFLENCSSGGLRIDLGIMRQTHATYLSDPDWPVHNLQLFWGASTMLAAERLLHWPFGDWRNTNPPPQQNFNPHDPNLTPAMFDFYTRTGMLGSYGASQKLPNLPGWVADRLVVHNRVYKETVRRFVREGVLYRLTGQPRRNGEGDRLCAFQYSLDNASEHLLFVFRMPGEVKDARVRLQDLEPGRRYSVHGLEGEYSASFTGQELMGGALAFEKFGEFDSALLKITTE